MKDIKSILKIAQNSIVAIVGFILSPLSWWNDLLVNVPLSFGFAYGIGRIISLFTDVSKGLFIFLFVAGYWLTNVVGMIMIEKGVRNIIAKKASRRSLALNMAITVAYSVLITVLVYQDYNGVLSTLHIIPEWVK